MRQDLSSEVFHWSKLRVISGFLLLALPLFLFFAFWTIPAPRAQPELLALAAQQPESRVGIIVQKTAKDGAVEDAVARLGGKVTKDLSLINAFAAEVNAKDVPQLARVEGVHWVSYDAPVKSSACKSPCFDTSKLASAYVKTIGADKVWNEPGYIQGQGIGVAVIDTAITRQYDFKDPITGDSRVITVTNFVTITNNLGDQYAHGTHVAGIIGGNGGRSTGMYVGVAPKVNLLSLKVSTNNGLANASDVVSALQWVYNYRNLYNIRVVNLSFNSSVQESYKTSPIDAAVEILWFNKIVVVAAAGNGGANGGVLTPPANDPFIITVGATKDNGTADPSDDVLAPYSSYGLTQDGFSKPELVAPGHNIVSVLANSGAQLPHDHPDHIVYYAGNAWYFRMSGTSMATAVTSGAVALLAQSNPNLTPDQIKYRLMATARPMNQPGTGAGELNIYAAVHATTTESANTGIEANSLLFTGSQPVNWTSVNWNSVNWNSVNWNSVNWNSVNWNSVNWNSVNWNSALDWGP